MRTVQICLKCCVLDTRRKIVIGTYLAFLLQDYSYNILNENTIYVPMSYLDFEPWS